MSRVRKAWVVVGLCAALAVGCSEPRPSRLGQPPCPSYEREVAPLLQQGCAECHGPAQASGGYRVDEYPRAVARREEGTARVVAGDKDSLLLAAARGELPGHSAVPAEALAVLESWVVRCSLPPSDYLFHVNGWMDPGNATQFHGRALRASAYELKECRKCHGEDLRGGTSKVGCQTCHAQGLEACGTCHGQGSSGAPPRDLDWLTATTRLGVGAHQVHLSHGPRHKAYACQTCHQVPATPGEPGHYVNAAGEVDEAPAEVVVAAGPLGEVRWDRQQATCTNTACHAPARDSKATRQAPRWNVVGQGEASCGTCHGLPPSTHASEEQRCQVCHRPAYNAAGSLLPELHANGRVELAATANTCVGCHGSGTSAAPPTDLTGRVDELLKTVGAHRAHLEALHGLSAPVACAECHEVPTTLRAAGHIDSTGPAEVFPTGAGTLARADGAQAMYDGATGTCTTYCHGAGSALSADTSSGRTQRPSWTGGTAQAACGTCHGIPPRRPGSTSHNGVSQLTQCGTCHSRTVLPGGSIRLETDASGRPVSTHMDGIVQYQLPPP